MSGTDLFDAVFNNRLNEVKSLLRHRKQDLNAVFSQVRDDQYKGMQPIHLAAHCGFTDLVSFLLQEGAEVNAGTVSFRRTPIHYAVLEQERSCLELLIRSGADLNVGDIFGNTPCHNAALRSVQILSVLLGAGVEVDARDISRRTPLMQAVRNDLAEATEVLLRAGADVNLTDGNGDVALHFAARNGLEGLVDVLLKWDALMDVQNSLGNTPLMEAIRNNRYGCARKLVHAGCDLHCQDIRWGDTALHLAVKKNDCGLVQLLLDAGSKTDVYDHQGETALFQVMDILQNTNFTVLALQRKNLLRIFLDFNCRLDVPVKMIPYVESKSAFQVAVEKRLLNTCIALAELGYVDYGARDVFYTFYLPARVLAVVEKILQEAPSLRQLCRKTIRKSLDHRLASSVDALPVPRGLKDYILARELKDCGEVEEEA